MIGAQGAVEAQEDHVAKVLGLDTVEDHDQDEEEVEAVEPDNVTPINQAEPAFPTIDVTEEREPVAAAAVTPIAPEIAILTHVVETLVPALAPLNALLVAATNYLKAQRCGAVAAPAKLSDTVRKGGRPKKLQAAPKRAPGRPKKVQAKRSPGRPKKAAGGWLKPKRAPGRPKKFAALTLKRKPGRPKGG